MIYLIYKFDFVVYFCNHIATFLQNFLPKKNQILYYAQKIRAKLATLELVKAGLIGVNISISIQDNGHHLSRIQAVIFLLYAKPRSLPRQFL